MRAFKVFNPDWTCKGFKYEVGKTYELKENGKLIEPEMCERGFHACKKVNDCFSYYNFNPSNKVAEVELSGTVLGENEDKQCSNIISIIKELSWHDMLVLANTGRGNSGHSNSGDWNSGHSNSGHSNSGDRNSGNWNSGNRNSGDSNSGDSNSGDSNSGNSNSGDWNSGNRNSGFFNTLTPNDILVFDKPCKREIWENAQKPDFIYLNLTEWVYFDNMTDQEKIDHPNAYVWGGYLKVIDYKQAWKEAFEKASERDIELLKALPNFDAAKFEIISGIKL